MCLSFHGRVSPGQEHTGCYCVSLSQVHWLLSASAENQHLCLRLSHDASENRGSINPHIQGGNQEPQGPPGGSWNLLGDRDLGNCLFPVIPLDVMQPNTSWSWSSLQAACLHLLCFTPTSIGAHRPWILIAHSDQLVLRLTPRCFKEKYNVLRSVRHRDPGSGGRGASCFSVVSRAGTRWSVRARADHRSAP